MNAAWLAGSLALVQGFRVQAGLPQLPPAAVSRLSASTPQTIAAARLEAAHQLLATVPPAYAPGPHATARTLVVSPPTAFDAAVTEARAVVAAELAAQKLDSLEFRLRPEGEVDVAALAVLYEGLPETSAVAAAVKGETTQRDLRELVLDGAGAEAAQRVGLLKLSRSTRRSLQARLASAPASPAVASLRRRVEAVEKRFGQGRYDKALEGAKDLFELVKKSGLREATRRAFGVRALELEERARVVGAPRVYGQRAIDIGERVRVQRHGDCAVHQLYNHPALAAVRGVLPYDRFLLAVERLLESPVRREGMLRADTQKVLQNLGFGVKVVSTPKTPEGWAQALRTHGPLLVSVRWTKPKSIRARSGDHAVLLRQAFQEKGRWKYVVVDSNFSRPQAYTYAELQLLSAGDLVAVVTPADADLSGAAADFAARYGAPARPWYLRLLDRLFGR